MFDLLITSKEEKRKLFEQIERVREVEREKKCDCNNFYSEKNCCGNSLNVKWTKKTEMVRTFNSTGGTNESYEK